MKNDAHLLLQSISTTVAFEEKTKQQFLRIPKCWKYVDVNLDT